MSAMYTSNQATISRKKFAFMLSPLLLMPAFASVQSYKALKQNFESTLPAVCAKKSPGAPVRRDLIITDSYGHVIKTGLQFSGNCPIPGVK